MEGPSQIRSPSPSAPVAAPPGGREGSAGSRGFDRSNPAHEEIGRERRTLTKWRVQFSIGSDPGNWIEGRLRFTPLSRWTVLLDLENDVLAGDYLPDSDLIELGIQFMIDEYDVVVGECVQVELPPQAVEMVDLTEAMVPGELGGRFWALIESDDEEQVENQASTGRLVVS